MRICIVSPDIVGPISNGGIGTACSALAQALAADGHEVTYLTLRAWALGGLVYDLQPRQRPV